MAYICKRTDEPLVINGDLNKPQWQRCSRSPRFVDVVGGDPGLYDTRAALLWDDTALYIGFWCEEPYPRATLTERDSLLWVENDLEVFIDGGDSYYELEINARNVIYEVFYIWQDAFRTNPLFQQERYDILKSGAQSFGGNFDRTDAYFWKGINPRGLRWAYHNWDFPGLQTAVQIDGVLNDDSVISRGWTAEIRFPWEGFRDLSTGHSLPPKAGEIWKLFMGRYESMRINGNPVSTGWSWDPIGIADNHNPEKYTQIMLSDETV